MLRADIADPAQITTLLNECRSRLGRLDLVVNNAATISHVPYAQLKLGEWERLLTTNLTAVEIERRYGKQTASRLAGEFEDMNFAGSDIRRLRKERGE